MIRVVIENVILLLLPTLIYIAYVQVKAQLAGTKPQRFDDAPLVVLFLCGVALVLVVVLAFGTTTGGTPGQAYRPPSFEGGRIEPGRIEPGRNEKQP
ncbi:MAG: DUF6111 family protein [Hyphomicrobiaceae bacterium]|nr:DUF6111 family protein [Hyphomicrobiaceae bacterium]